MLKQLTNCTILSTTTQDSDEQAWLKNRTRGIGGSDIGPICGVSPFSSARQVYLTKTGQYPDSLAPGGAALERMSWGHKLEPVVADEFERRYNADLLAEGRRPIKLKVANATLAHKDHPWALANVDRLIVDAETDEIIGILECKTTSEYQNDEWDSGEILQSYVYQLNWYLFVTGLTKGAFACLVGGNKFYYYEVTRNDELIRDVLLPQADHFWHENILKMVEPPLNHIDTEMCNVLYEDCKPNSEIFFDDDVTNSLAETIVDCKRQIKELKFAMEAAQNALKEKMQENEIAYTQDYIVKWSPRRQVRIDSDKVKKEFPDVAAACPKVVTFRAMTIKGAV